MKIQQIIKAYWLPVGGVLVLIGSIVFLLPSQIHQIRQLHVKKNNLARKLQLSKQKYLLLSNFDENTLQQQLQLARSLLPPKKDIPQILHALYATANRYSFLITSIQLAPGEIQLNSPKKSQKNRLEEIPILLEVVGPQQNLAKFLTALGKTTPLFAVRSFKVQVGTSKEIAEANLALSTFVFRWLPPKPSSLDVNDLILTEKEQSLLEKLAQSISRWQTLPPLTSPQPEPGNKQRDPFKEAF